jgi:hypothetical protein
LGIVPNNTEKFNKVRDASLHQETTARRKHQGSMGEVKEVAVANKENVWGVTSSGLAEGTGKVPIRKANDVLRRPSKSCVASSSDVQSSALRGVADAKETTQAKRSSRR